MYNIANYNAPDRPVYLRRFGGGCCGARLCITKQEFLSCSMGIVVIITDEKDDSFMVEQEHHEKHYLPLGGKHVYIKLLKEPFGGVDLLYEALYNKSGAINDLFFSFSLEGMCGFGLNQVKFPAGYYFLISVHNTKYNDREYKRYLANVAEAGFKLIKEYDPCYNANYIHPMDEDDEDYEEEDLSQRLKLSIFSYNMTK